MSPPALYSLTHTACNQGLYKHTMAHLGFDEEKKKRWKGEAAAPKESAKAD